VRRWVAVASGETSSGIGDDGNLYLWGSANNGVQLTPLRVSKPSTASRWLYVATGGLQQYPSAIADDGNLYQWDFGNPIDPVLVPRPEGVSAWLKVATGRSYYLVLAANGELFEWGSPVHRQIGKVARPDGVTRWIDASSAVSHRLALGDNGELYLWDYPAPIPALGHVTRPANVKYWKRISAGYGISAAIGSDDSLYVWESPSVQPTAVPFPGAVRKWISVAAGTGAVLLLGDDCRLYAWGNSFWGQLGTGTAGLTIPGLVKNLDHLCVPALPANEPGALTLAPFDPLFQPEREFRFHVLGNAAQAFVLFRSTDLKHWTPHSTNPPLAGWRALSDTIPESATSLFYRIVTP